MKYLISLLFFLVLIIPVYEVFVPYEDKPEWELTFIWEDFVAFVSYILLALLWFAYLKKQHTFLRFLLVIFSGMSLIGMLLAVAMPSMDLIFLLGMPLYMILCLLLSFYLMRVEKRISKSPADKF